MSKTINHKSLTSETVENDPLFTDLTATEADTTQGGCGGLHGRGRGGGRGFSSMFSRMFQMFTVASLFSNSFNRRNYNGNFNVTALNEAEIGDNNNIYIL